MFVSPCYDKCVWYVHICVKHETGRKLDPLAYHVKPRSVQRFGIHWGSRQAVQRTKGKTVAAKATIRASKPATIAKDVRKAENKGGKERT